MSIFSIHKNPEFKRNLLLEFNIQRLALMPIIIGLLYLIRLNIGLGSAAEIANHLSQILFAIIIFGWGTWQATTSFIDEINDKTWELQRMTSINPWTMAIGKLFGSTIYNWYGAAMVSFVYFGTCFSLDHTAHRIKVGIIAILAGIMIHAFTMMLSLFLIRKNRDKNKINTRPISILAVIFGINFTINLMLLGKKSSPIYWYEIPIDDVNLAFIFVLFYLVWSIVGLYYLVRSELQIMNKPNAWLLFIITNALLIAGLVSNLNLKFNFSEYAFDAIESHVSSIYYIYTFLFACFLTSLGTVYLLLLLDIKDFIGFKKILIYFKEKQYKNLYHEMPIYMTSFIYAIISAFILIIYSMIVGKGDSENAPVAVTKFLESGTIYIFSILLFAVRDIGIFLWVNFSVKSKRADTLAFTYLVLLYVLIPTFSMQMDKSLINIFYPNPLEPNVIGIISPLIQTGIIGLLLFNKFKSQRKINTTY